MPTRRYHTRDATGVNSPAVMRRSGGKRGLGQMPKRMRRSRRK